MAHLRREFVEVAKVAPEDPVPPGLVREFDGLYAINARPARKIWTNRRGANYTRARASRYMAAVKTRLTAVRQQVTPRERTG